MRALLILLLLASTAHADVNHEASVGSYTRALRSSSANALTEDSLYGPVFAYGYRLPLDVMPKLQLWGTGTFALGFGEGEMFQTLDTSIESLQMSAGVRARYALWRRYVVANARLDLGAQRVEVSLEDRDYHVARDSGWGAMSTAALGLELHAVSRESFALGFRAELGYVATQAIGLTAKSNGAPSDTIELDRMAASIGHLDLGGRYFSLTFLGRF
jgi:hypothetical protein